MCQRFESVIWEYSVHDECDRLKICLIILGGLKDGEVGQ